jgi:hypothetical protein
LISAEFAAAAALLALFVRNVSRSRDLNQLAAPPLDLEALVLIAGSERARDELPADSPLLLRTTGDGPRGVDPLCWRCTGLEAERSRIRCLE